MSESSAAAAPDREWLKTVFDETLSQWMVEAVQAQARIIEAVVSVADKIEASPETAAAGNSKERMAALYRHLRELAEACVAVARLVVNNETSSGSDGDGDEVGALLEAGLRLVSDCWITQPMKTTKSGIDFLMVEFMGRIGRDMDSWAEEDAPARELSFCHAHPEWRDLSDIQVLKTQSKAFAARLNMDDAAEVMGSPKLLEVLLDHNGPWPRKAVQRNVIRKNTNPFWLDSLQSYDVRLAERIVLAMGLEQDGWKLTLSELLRDYGYTLPAIAGAAAGLLPWVVVQTGTERFHPMPPVPALTADAIALVSDWRRAGDRGRELATDAMMDTGDLFIAQCDRFIAKIAAKWKGDGTVVHWLADTLPPHPSRDLSALMAGLMRLLTSLPLASAQQASGRLTTLRRVSHGSEESLLASLLALYLFRSVVETLHATVLGNATVQTLMHRANVPNETAVKIMREGHVELIDRLQTAVGEDQARLFAAIEAVMATTLGGPVPIANKRGPVFNVALDPLALQLDMLRTMSSLPLVYAALVHYLDSWRFAVVTGAGDKFGHEKRWLAVAQAEADALKPPAATPMRSLLSRSDFVLASSLETFGNVIVGGGAAGYLSALALTGKPHTWHEAREHIMKWAAAGGVRGSELLAFRDANESRMPRFLRCLQPSNANAAMAVFEWFSSVGRTSTLWRAVLDEAPPALLAWLKSIEALHSVTGIASGRYSYEEDVINNKSRANRLLYSLVSAPGPDLTEQALALFFELRSILVPLLKNDDRK